MRLVAVHPGVTPQQVQDATGFPLHIPGAVAVTPAPTPAQLALLERFDPHHLRVGALGG